MKSPFRAAALLCLLVPALADARRHRSRSHESHDPAWHSVDGFLEYSVNGTDSGRCQVALRNKGERSTRYLEFRIVAPDAKEARHTYTDAIDPGDEKRLSAWRVEAKDCAAVKVKVDSLRYTP